MHDYIPMAVSLLVIAFNVGLGLYELVDRNRLRSIGTDFFGERTWKLIEHSLTGYAFAFLLAAIAFLIGFEKGSSGYIAGIGCLFGAWLFFVLSIQRTQFFADNPSEKRKKVITFVVIGAVFAASVLFPRSKAIQPISGTQPPPSVPVPIPGPPVQPPPDYPEPRSYLVFDGVPYFPGPALQIGEPLGFNVAYKQVGPNPVEVTEIAKWIFLEPDYEASTQEQLITDFKKRMQVERAQGKGFKESATYEQGKTAWDTTVARTSDLHIRLATKDDLEALQAGTQIAFVVWQITYKDNDKPHHARLCYWLQPPAAYPGVWHGCNGFNHAD